MNDLFRFIGNQEDGLGYEYGKVYLLELHARGMGTVYITAPIPCDYADWNAFLKNWERV